MPKAETTFKPIGDSAKRMHGHPGVLISGFSEEEQSFLLQHFTPWGVADIPLIVIGTSTLPLTLAEASALPAKTNFGETPELPRAVIMSGLQEKQLNALMRGYRESGLPRPLWASVTAHSSTWTVKYLLVELLKEREAMRQAMLAKQQKQTPPEDQTE